MFSNIIRKTGIIGLCIIAAIVVVFVMKLKPETVTAQELYTTVSWEDEIVCGINNIRDKYGLAHLEWSYYKAEAELALSTEHDGSIYSEDSIFTEYIVKFWFNKDNSLFLDPDVKYVYVEMKMEDNKLIVDLYFPSKEMTTTQTQSPDITVGNTSNYDMEEKILDKRPVVEVDSAATSPVFLETDILIPVYAFDNIYDYAKYVQASDVDKVVLIQAGLFRDMIVSPPESSEAPDIQASSSPEASSTPPEATITATPPGVSPSVAPEVSPSIAPEILPGVTPEGSPEVTAPTTEIEPLQEEIIQYYLSAIAVNNHGQKTEKRINISYSEIEYYNSIVTGDEGYCYTVNKNGEVEQYGHVILQQTDGSEMLTGKYVFEITNPDGTTIKIIRNSIGMIWNPTQCGIHTIRMYRIEDPCRVKDISDIIEFSIEVKEFISVEIILPTLDFSQDTTYIKNDENCTIYGVNPGTSVADFINGIVIIDAMEDTVVVVSDKTEEDMLGSGCIVNLQSKDGSNVYKTYTILCYGDINGDGLVGIADFSKLRAYFLGRVDLDGVYGTCADINFDGTIGIADFSKMRAAILGRIEIEQTKQFGSDEE